MSLFDFDDVDVVIVVEHINLLLQPHVPPRTMTPHGVLLTVYQDLQLLSTNLLEPPEIVLSLSPGVGGEDDGSSSAMEQRSQARPALSPVLRVQRELMEATVLDQHQVRS